MWGSKQNCHAREGGGGGVEGGLLKTALSMCPLPKRVPTLCTAGLLYVTTLVFYTLGCVCHFEVISLKSLGYCMVKKWRMRT